MTVEERTIEQERAYFGAPGDFMTVRHVTVRGTNVEIGRALGKLAIDRYGRTPAHLSADPTYARARRMYIQRQYPIHWERMQGVAAAFGLDPEDDRYDLTSLAYHIDLPMPAHGCSVVYYPPAATATGGGFLSRNYDFPVGSIADLFQIPLPPAVKQQFPPLMSEPYVMEWYPVDGGYASLAIHAFDTLAGTLDGINSAGLVVSILADNEAMAELGPRLEPHPGTVQVVGLHELQVMRLLLDTCATAAEAKETLLTIKQFYRFIPCHYIVADRTGQSFIYENSTGRNVQHVIDGDGQPQVATNFQLYKHPTAETMAVGNDALESAAYRPFWRYRQLTDQIASHPSGLTATQMKEANACVNVLNAMEAIGPVPAQPDQTAGVPVRTVWHSLYDQEAGTLEVSFYLGEAARADGRPGERRSEYQRFVLGAS